MRLHGRSSSHFTRIARIFAAELELELEFVLIRDLMSADAADYGDNPALKMPTLVGDDGERWFGSIAICRGERRPISPSFALWKGDSVMPMDPAERSRETAG